MNKSIAKALTLIIFFVFAILSICFADNSVITKVEKGDIDQTVKITSERQDNTEIKVTVMTEMPLKILIKQKNQLEEQKAEIEEQITKVGNIIKEAKEKGVKEE